VFKERTPCLADCLLAINCVSTYGELAKNRCAEGTQTGLVFRNSGRSRAAGDPPGSWGREKRNNIGRVRYMSMLKSGAYE